MEESKDKQPSLALDLSIVALAAALIIISAKLGLQAGHPAAKGAGATVDGIYLIYLGAIFLLSYVYPKACHVFRFMKYLSENWSYPRSRHMALFYFGLALSFGTWLLLIGLGACAG